VRRAWPAWLALLDDPAVRRALAEAGLKTTDLGASDREASHWLLADRHAGALSIGSPEVVRDRLRCQAYPHAEAGAAGCASGSRTPLVWVDVETTGLDTRRDLLLEIAVVVTDADLAEVAACHRLVAQPPDEVAARLAGAPEAARLHARSGLLADLAGARGQAVGLGDLDAELAALLERHGAVGAPLAGFSVGFDRTFLHRDLPRLAARVGYRTVDVSTLSELARRWWPRTAQLARGDGEAAHRALGDVRCAIAALRRYRERLEQGAAR
jgi:oligoribonuclease